jgi:hypothetical protein
MPPLSSVGVWTRIDRAHAIPGHIAHAYIRIYRDRGSDADMGSRAGEGEGAGEREQARV